MKNIRVIILLSIIFSCTFLMLGCTLEEKSEVTVSNETDASNETVYVKETSLTINVDTRVDELDTVETTEFITSLPYMRTIEFDGNSLSDGIYLIKDISFDENGLGCTANVFGHNYLLEEDLLTLNVGDVIYYKDYLYDTDEELICKYTVNELPKENSYVEYGLVKQFNGQYILWGEDCAPIVTPDYPVVKDYHLDISENVLIFDNAGIYGISEEIYQNFIDEGYYQSIYPDIISFSDDWENNASRHPSIFVVVENETIVKMFVNPQLHQDWHSYTYGECN